MSTRPPRLLDPLRVRIRRAQLIIGIGFLAVVLGAILSAALAAKIAPRLAGTDNGWVRLVASVLVVGVWAYAVLPALCYGAARILELKPWSTALGAAATGEAFSLAILFVTGDLTSEGAVVRHLIPRTLVFAAAVLLSAWAIRQGRAHAAVQADAAKAAAASKKDEYAEFTREAERLAARHEEKAAATAAAAESGAAQAPAAPAEPPRPSDPPAAPAEPTDPPKT